MAACTGSCKICSDIDHAPMQGPVTVATQQQQQLQPAPAAEWMTADKCKAQDGEALKADLAATAADHASQGLPFQVGRRGQGASSSNCT